MDRHKLGIVVPYRHRERDLPIFLEHMTQYLSEFHTIAKPKDPTIDG